MKQNIFSQNFTELLETNNLFSLPSHTKRKGPFLKDWQKLSHKDVSTSKYQDYLKRYATMNICIPLGQVNGIIAIDIDFEKNENPQLYKDIINAVGPTPLIKKGSKGETRFYKYNGEKTKQYKGSINENERTIVEILSNNRTTDIPPSIHPETKLPYVYLSKLTFNTPQIKQMLPKLPNDILEKLHNLIRPYSTSTPKFRNTGRQEKLKSMVISALNGGKDINTVAREVFVYDKKHHSPNYFSDHKEFGDEAFFPLKVCSRFVASIFKTISTNSDTGFKSINLSDLLNMKTVKQDWLVSDLLPKTGTSVLAGPPKCGKSQLARDLMRCISDEVNFLGRQVSPGKCLLVLCEESPENIQPMIKKQCIQFPKNIEIITPVPGQKNLIELAKKIRQSKPSFVIIDTLHTFHHFRDISSYSEVYPVIDSIGKIAKENACHIMIIHHSRKGGDGTSDSILGSQGIFAGVDTSLMIHQVQGSNEQTFITSKQRYSSNNFSSALLRRNSRNLSWKAYKTLEEYRLKKIAQSMLKATSSKGSFKKSIFEKVPGKNSIKLKAFHYLIMKGLLKRSGFGTKSRPYIYKPLKKEVGTTII